ncbi:hypothetical protein EHQ94_03700 [Leptospira meyeri]|uniref:hypothetical protein n=1 Tax=Leptospira meyeri TaxID=29508 RepID=UPI0010826541|nr:hypothetical protein [Leptospira meyeri]MCW7489885.1 hypothetical protein [Leptospira meyeri]TGM71127.1 hypothetical protein EHQ94_03700 [Leptospira meyeri]
MELRTIIIGGVVPALLLGMGTVIMKLSLRAGISLPIYLVFVGFSIFCYGVVFAFQSGMKDVTLSGGLFAFLMGLSWSTAIYCMSYGISVLKLPVSVIAPLTNSNAIVAVIIGAIVFSEWKDLNFVKVLIGTVLIVVGGVVVSSSLQPNVR